MDILQKKNELFSAMKSVHDTIETRSLNGEDCTEDMKKYEALKNQFDAIAKVALTGAELRSIETDVTKPIDSREGVVTDANTEDPKAQAAFVDYCRSGVIDEVRSMNTFSTSEGAALVGKDMYSQLDTYVRGVSVVRQLPGVAVIKTSKLVTIPYPTTGVTSTVVKEGPSGSYSTTEIVYGSKNLNAFKQGGIIKVSEELLTDADFDIATYINQQIAEDVGFKEETLFISGSGTNEPLGILRMTDGTDTTVQSGSVADGLIDAQFVNSHLRQNGVYVMGPGLAKAARKIKNTEGDFLWSPSLVEGQPPTFNGRPVFITDAAPATLTAGTVAGAYVVPSDLIIGDRLPVSVKRLDERYAEEGFVGFKFSKRSDIILKNTKGLSRLIWG